jgi:D-sedoheptulose 7-phosphate isomerase
MKRETKERLIEQAADDAVRLRRVVTEKLTPGLIDLAETISGILGSGGKILICGNGGSAADSSHFAAEMIVRLTAERNRQSLPAIALNTDSSILTAAANDYGFENAFARQVQGLGQAGDVLILISTSGNSANLIKAAKAARDKNILTVGILGGDGGSLAAKVDKNLTVPHSSVQRIQEEQIFLIHLLVELIESDLLPAD